MPPIKVHHTDISEGAWDGPGNVARLRSGENASYYHKMFAWQDPEGDPATKAAYKFPHHEVSSDGEPGAANVKGCQSGIGVLNGAMGGADIPDSDRQGVYRHLAAHLEDADVEPADLRTLRPQREREERSFQIIVRAADGDDQEPKITGHAAVFDQLSDDLGGFRERIQPGAFTKTLQESDVRALWQHDVNYVLGRRKNDTLKLWEDDAGLAFEILPPNTQWASDALVTLQRGDVDQMSFGFITIRDRWEEDEEEKLFIRTLVEVELFDVSPVTFPAYPQTSAQVRATLSELQRSTAAPGQGPHPADADDDQARARLDVLRRRLDLAEHI